MFHRLDNVTASLYIVVNYYTVFETPSLVMVLISVLFMMAAFRFSRMSRSPSEWVIRHSLWHVVGVACTLLGFSTWM